MADHADQTTMKGDDTPSSELAERLVQRRTRPAGVIDVRQPQQLYARTAGWVIQRFALSADLSGRYGSEEPTADTGRELLMGRPLMPQIFGDPDASPSLSRSAFSHQPTGSVAPSSRASIDANPLPHSTGSQTKDSPVSQGKLRISRKPSASTPIIAPSTDATAEPSESPSDSHQPGGDLNAGETGSPDAFASPYTPLTSSIPVISSVAAKSPEMTTLILPKMVSGGSQETESSAHESVKADAVNTSSAPAISLTPEPSTTRTESGALAQLRQPSQDVLTQEVSVEGGAAKEMSARGRAAKSASSPETIAQVASRPTAELILRKVSTEVSEDARRQIPPSEISSLTQSPAATSVARAKEALSPTAYADATDRLPLAKPQISSAPIQRKALESNSSSPEPRETPDGERHQPVVVIKETQAHSSPSPKPNMIWRKSTNSSRPNLPDAGAISARPTVLARQADEIESSGSGETIIPANPSAGQEDGIDLERITEQVIRALSRKLTVERERRG